MEFESTNRIAQVLFFRASTQLHDRQQRAAEKPQPIRDLEKYAALLPFVVIVSCAQ